MPSMKLFFLVAAGLISGRPYSRARVLNAFLEPKDIPLSVHEDMLKAIESHEGDKAARLVRQHMANQETGIRKLMQLYPDYFI